MSNEETLKRKLKNCSSLISLPTIAMQVLELSEDPDSGLNDVEKTIQNDPALSAKLIRVANSPLFSRGRNIDSILKALTLLGLDSALSLTLSFSLMGALRSDDEADDSSDYWRRSIISAICARELASTVLVSNAGSLFLAGLLQDIGILALKQLQPDAYFELQQKAENHDHLSQLELEQIGLNHQQTGEYLANQWHMPPILARATAESHDYISQVSDDDDKFVGCAQLASRMADAIMHSEDVQPCDFVKQGALLGLDSEGLDEILIKVLDQLPELAGLFEMELLETSELEAIQERSKEVLMMRTVHSEIKARKQAEQTASIERHSRNLEEIARRDGLTGAFNRQHLDQALNSEFNASSHQNQALSVAFIDFDHFKVVNDTYGHQAGDNALRALSSVITETKREQDTFGRYGGEEFVLIMPNTSEQDAEHACMRMIKSIRQTIIQSDDCQFKVTASIGIACHNSSSPFAHADQLLKAADIALYDAKQNGRNRICVYQSRVDRNGDPNSQAG